jgi:hypothetical protein
MLLQPVLGVIRNEPRRRNLRIKWTAMIFTAMTGFNPRFRLENLAADILGSNWIVVIFMAITGIHIERGIQSQIMSKLPRTQV